MEVRHIIGEDVSEVEPSKQFKRPACKYPALIIALGYEFFGNKALILKLATPCLRGRQHH